MTNPKASIAKGRRIKEAEDSKTKASSRKPGRNKLGTPVTDKRAPPTQHGGGATDLSCGCKLLLSVKEGGRHQEEKPGRRKAPF